jgi:hypothetical protein
MWQPQIFSTDCIQNCIQESNGGVHRNVGQGKRPKLAESLNKRPNNKNTRQKQ